MRLKRRIAVVGSVVVVVGILALVLRALDAMGLFTETVPMACRSPSWIAGAVGIRDLKYDATDHLLFIAEANFGKPLPVDGIYAWRPGVDQSPVKLSGTGPSFNPRSIQVVRENDRSVTLIALAMTGRRPMLDVFDVTGIGTNKIALKERETVSSDLLVNPASILALDANGIYVTNDTTRRTRLGRAIVRALVLPEANVIYFDGMNFRKVAGDLKGASGIADSADGMHVYVAEMMGREIRTYKRDPFAGELTFQRALPIASGLDQMNRGADGSLYVVGHPKMWDLLHYRRDPTRTTDSQVFRVSVGRDSIPTAARLVYSGNDISAASVAAEVGNRLLIGSPFTRKILSCALQH